MRAVLAASAALALSLAGTAAFAQQPPPVPPLLGPPVDAQRLQLPQQPPTS